jgi:hypothetical protein
MFGVRRSRTPEQNMNTNREQRSEKRERLVPARPLREFISIAYVSREARSERRARALRVM